ncbi:matrix metalloproteinase-9-like [Paroedura picta]|uniref:matrix metalloproteinase-9-like n=1 Tax=Paroedura picta TaxID=143630 RepID=UPI0040563FDF
MGFLSQLVLCAFLLPFSAAFLDFAACTFPFVYKNKTYSTCTREGSRFDWLWCATTSSYDNDYKWKHCYEKEHGGNSHGKPCVFPFVYRSRKFYTCTDERARSRMFWCATTSNYDNDKKWSYCADTILVGNLTSDADHKRTDCDSSDPRCLIEADWMKLTDVNETGYGEYEQEGDKDDTIALSVDPIL